MKPTKQQSKQFIGGRYFEMKARKKVALIAHDNKKADLLDWADFNKGSLSHHELFATGTTGKILAKELDLPIHRFRSGPIGGDQQVGSKIAEGGIDFMIFFWDPMAAQPHDVDVKALLRLATVYNIPVACNRATADFVISSPMMKIPYERLISDYVKLFGE
ncbi:MAG: methylglyoxal synthase [Balneolales bacterium]